MDKSLSSGVGFENGRFVHWLRMRNLKWNGYELIREPYEPAVLRFRDKKGKHENSQDVEACLGRRGLELTAMTMVKRLVEYVT